MKRVYICSPLGGDVLENIEKAKEYARYVFECGMAPVIPHFYALILNDESPSERSLGIKAGISLLFGSDELWVFGDKNSEGMKKEMGFAEKLNIKIRYISELDLKKRRIYK